MLTFATGLVHYPHDVIAYVVIHELAHLFHPNHAAPFWQCVTRYCPQWRTQRHALRQPHEHHVYPGPTEPNSVGQAGPSPVAAGEGFGRGLQGGVGLERAGEGTNGSDRDWRPPHGRLGHRWDRARHRPRGTLAIVACDARVGRRRGLHPRDRVEPRPRRRTDVRP
ncbi:MAG: M48 family peptidase [Proteobacteria bacterium]|nr:M48 family peptidase [Pseudomonadota bacterium]